MDDRSRQQSQTSPMERSNDTIPDRLLAWIDRQPQRRLTMAQFMSWALYDPQSGYYSSRTGQFGDRGDFVTAPTLSADFAELLACRRRSFGRFLGSPIALTGWRWVLVPVILQRIFLQLSPELSWNQRCTIGSLSERHNCSSSNSSVWSLGAIASLGGPGRTGQRSQRSAWRSRMSWSMPPCASAAVAG